MNIVEWAQAICITIGGAFGLFCLFDGTRRMAVRDARGGAGRLAATGLTIVLLVAGYAYYQSWQYADVARAYRGEQTRELPADWGKKMTPAKREAASQHMARGIFVNSGQLRQYFDQAGQRKVYAPVQDDLKKREAVLAQAARIEQRASETFTEFVLWLVLGLSAFVFGLCFALEPTAKAPDADAEAEEQAPPAA